MNVLRLIAEPDNVEPTNTREGVMKNKTEKKSTKREKVVEGNSVFEDLFEESDNEGEGKGSKKLISRHKLLDLTFG